MVKVRDAVGVGVEVVTTEVVEVEDVKFKPVKGKAGKVDVFGVEVEEGREDSTGVVY
jgi:hypothetical protein